MRQQLFDTIVKGEMTQEYKDVLNMIQDPGYSKGDIYEKIMQKEDNALNILNRIAENELKKELRTDNFLDMSVLQVIASFADSWKRLYQEAILEPNYQKIIALMWTPKYRVHVGLMVLLVAIMVFFVEISQ